jgi:hypothetical protein
MAVVVGGAVLMPTVAMAHQQIQVLEETAAMELHLLFLVLQ